ncbi:MULTISPECIES: hypothetical protein [unclassified Aureimonas]|uniref:hypothetical protein n=1 Tax=unclassified Aureimonas TaxID=2615206 RepID=UPI0006F335D6|nr:MULTISPECIES: hypothetical protein [unclassified Aureimonas]KQT60367.1 hypothetical protein ASG62_06835 [Aureimonas sp. Leaf427]KQT79245.1 hypothetical protein ASG54_09435 [Aureimonas sp. Leaf460]
MSNISFLQNVGEATKLKEGSIPELMKRLKKIEEGLSDVEKAKLNTAVADAFTNVSATLDKIELNQAQAVVNRLQGGDKRQSSSFRLPAADGADRQPFGQNRGNGFALPKATD